MNWQLTWSAASHVTGWYAVERRLDGRLSATDWRDTIDDATAELAGPLGARVLPTDLLLALLRECMSAWSDDSGRNVSVTLDAHARTMRTADVESLVRGISRRLATDLPATNFSDDDVQELTKRLMQIARRFAASWPRLADELPLRAGPLREQWEARGPGLMRRIQRLWHDAWRIDAARIELVYPVYGGGGVALGGSVVAFEAMLYNGLPALPEILRLGWLLAQLPGLNDRSPGLIGRPAEHTMSDLPLPHEELALRQRLALALLPVVLDAGEYVELTRNDGATLRIALGAWCGCDAPTAERLGTRLETWWRTRQSRRDPA